MPGGMPGVKWFIGVAGSDPGGPRCAPERGCGSRMPAL